MHPRQVIGIFIEYQYHMDDGRPPGKGFLKHSGEGGVSRLRAGGKRTCNWLVKTQYKKLTRKLLKPQ